MKCKLRTTMNLLVFGLKITFIQNTFSAQFILIKLENIFFVNFQQYYGYSKYDAADDNDCYVDLPLEVVLQEYDNLKDPTNRCSGENPFAWQQFIESSSLEKHEESADQEILLNCDICNKLFSERYSLNAHKLSIHHGMLYDCNICERSFNHLAKLIRHKNIVHQKVSYTCALCEKSFRNFSTLETHEMLKHQKMNHACAIRDEKFSSITDPRKHLAKHTGFTCDNCKKSFTLLSNLKRHKNTVNCKKRF